MKPLPGWIQTFTGKAFSPVLPDPAAVDIRDIAHALSNVCRFGGHTKWFYSVAQHACLVSDYSNDRLHGLNHDDNEAYMCDVPRPWKRYVLIGTESYAQVEDHNLEVIYHALRIPWPTVTDQEDVKRVDTAACVTEALQLMSPLHPDWTLTPEHGYDPLPGVIIEPWDPRRAESEFLLRYERLTR